MIPPVVVTALIFLAGAVALPILYRAIRAAYNDYQDEMSFREDEEQDAFHEGYFDRVGEAGPDQSSDDHWRDVDPGGPRRPPSDAG